MAINLGLEGDVPIPGNFLVALHTNFTFYVVFITPLCVNMILIKSKVLNPHAGSLTRDTMKKPGFRLHKQNSHRNLSNPVVLTIFKDIVDTLKWEKENGHAMSPIDIFKTPSAQKRLIVGMSPGPFSYIAGNIIVSYYFGSELDSAGITDRNEQLKVVCLLAKKLLLQDD